MKKLGFLTLLTIISLVLNVNTSVASEVKTQLTSDETTYGGSKFPVGQTVYQDDLSETIVNVSGNGNPYQIHTTQNFKVNLTPSSLRGKEWLKNMGRITMIQTGIPEAVFRADGIMGWNIKKLTNSELKADLYIGLSDGRQVTMTHHIYHRSNGWYNTLEMQGGTVKPSNVIDWIGPEKVY